MITVYAVSLAVGFVGLLVAIFGAALAENLHRPGLDPVQRFGSKSRVAIGAVTGFGMGGMAAEFSPIGFGTGASLVIALAAAVVAVLWVRYATEQAGRQ